MTPSEAIEIMERELKYTPMLDRYTEQALEIAIAALKAQAALPTLDDLAAQQGVTGPTDLADAEPVEFEPVYVPTDAELILFALMRDVEDVKQNKHPYPYIHFVAYGKFYEIRTGTYTRRCGEPGSITLQNTDRAILTPPYLAWRKEGEAR